MVKYRIREEALAEKDVPILLQCIANELAERNRLKRMELEYVHAIKELEDHA